MTHPRQRIRETVGAIVEDALGELGRSATVLTRGPRTRIERFPAIAITIPSETRTTTADDPADFADVYEATLSVAITVDGEDDLDTLDAMLDAIDAAMNEAANWSALDFLNSVELSETTIDAALDGGSPELMAAELSYSLEYTRTL